jgi:hypothetical protein
LILDSILESDRERGGDELDWERGRKGINLDWWRDSNEWELYVRSLFLLEDFELFIELLGEEEREGDWERESSSTSKQRGSKRDLEEAREREADRWWA